MVFAFQRADLDVADNVRRTAREEFDLAIAEVGETGFEVHDTVRNVRRRLKRIRSLLRLIRPVLPDYAAENAALRDIGAEVSALRDARALVEAAERLGRASDPALAASIGRWRRHLMGRAAGLEADLDREVFLLDLRTKLREARVRSELWELTGTGRRSIVPGVTAAYRKARRGYRVAARSPEDDELFHEWRKHLKHHLGHLKLLRDLTPAFALERRRRMSRLATILGDIQNLCVLRDALPEAPEAQDQIGAALAGQLAKERRRALRAGKRLFREKPRVIRHRWHVYFEDWRSAQKLLHGASER